LRVVGVFLLFFFLVFHQRLDLAGAFETGDSGDALRGGFIKTVELAEGCSSRSSNSRV
jgi:hypothetical protein